MKCARTYETEQISAFMCATMCIVALAGGCNSKIDAVLRVELARRATRSPEQLQAQEDERLTDAHSDLAEHDGVFASIVVDLPERRMPTREAKYSKLRVQLQPGLKSFRQAAKIACDYTLNSAGDALHILCPDPSTIDPRDAIVRPVSM